MCFPHLVLPPCRTSLVLSSTFRRKFGNLPACSKLPRRQNIHEAIFCAPYAVLLFYGKLTASMPFSRPRILWLNRYLFTYKPKRLNNGATETDLLEELAEVIIAETRRAYHRARGSSIDIDNTARRIHLRHRMVQNFLFFLTATLLFSTNSRFSRSRFRSARS